MNMTTESIIDDLVSTVSGERSAREQYLLRQSLLNLVRLARAEQLLEIRTSVQRLTGSVPHVGLGHNAKIEGL